MQINNPNGQTIVIDKVDINQNRVTYSKYEYGNQNKIGDSVGYKFQQINLKDNLDIQTNFTELCYLQIIVEKEPDFVMSEEEQNWTIVDGSTEDTKIRIYMPSVVLGEVLNSGNDLDLLIQNMFVLSGYMQRLAGGNMQYLIFLLDNDRTILEAYPTIVIEDKL